MKKTLYRTVISMEILSEEPIGDVDMETILYEINDGSWSGKNTTIIQDKPVIGKKAVELVMNQGSDISFFSIDENGNEIN